LNPKPQNIWDGVFSNAALKNATLYVPATSVNAYETTIVWKDFGKITAYVPSAIKVPASDNAVRIYPNPAQNDLYIQSDAPVEKVEIYTLSGLRVLVDAHFSGKTDISKLNSGTYLLRVYIQGNVVSEKLIIK
jgi:hypothetical protein